MKNNYRKFLEKKLKELRKINYDLLRFDYDKLINKKVKISKKHSQWVSQHGDMIGIPYDHMKFIESRPKGLIVNARYDSINDGFVFEILFTNGSKERVGIDGFELI